MMKKILFFASLLLCLTPIFAYDNFSGTTLDTTKWTVSKGSGQWFLEEYGLNVTEGTFHTRQNLLASMRGGTTVDSTARITIAGHSFISGDFVEFDIIYHSGLNNRIARILPDLNLGILDGVDIGYWNANKEAGSATGTYHVKVTYGDASATVNVTKPDGTVYSKKLTKNMVSPYTFSVETKADPIAKIHIDYDNFYINDCPEGYTNCNGTCTAPACSIDSECDDSDVSTTDSCEDGGTCSAVCTNTAITECAAGDSYCPEGCYYETDTDCASCETGIICEGSCQVVVCSADSGCDDGDDTTTDSCQNPGTCDASCINAAVTDCLNDDSTCPSGCTSTNDNDCTVQCGNGVCETGEDYMNCLDDCEAEVEEEEKEPEETPEEGTDYTTIIIVVVMIGIGGANLYSFMGKGAAKAAKKSKK